MKTATPLTKMEVYSTNGEDFNHDSLEEVIEDKVLDSYSTKE
jgi:hypothetical protein